MLITIFNEADKTSILLMSVGSRKSIAVDPCKWVIYSVTTLLCLLFICLNSSYENHCKKTEQVMPTNCFQGTPEQITQSYQCVNVQDIISSKEQIIKWHSVYTVPISPLKVSMNHSIVPFLLLLLFWATTVKLVSPAVPPALPPSRCHI